ncbi:hypothetical protein TEA_009936 [Camellia sinensis var. sinensis]|uniref:DNA-3-methyladenine glycosylase I n=1 Tax=Camellia sinensis var. sinensis TaxID=542762 RepID=A0A4S4CZX4_CAMSN|nr:hypothetical protein TEA_009936 [Camellia sinensis var. sinensis]
MEKGRVEKKRGSTEKGEGGRERGRNGSEGRGKPPWLVGLYKNLNHLSKLTNLVRKATNAQFRITKQLVADPCYAVFHDEEWGVPIHDDKYTTLVTLFTYFFSEFQLLRESRSILRSVPLIFMSTCRKLFELLILSTALAELSWPAILNKRHMFREVFLDFDPIAVSKLNEKRTVTPGSAASALLSELKLRTIIENARQTRKVLISYVDRNCLDGSMLLIERHPLTNCHIILLCKHKWMEMIIIDEFGSFDKYIWGFVNHKPTVSHFRYPRQVPIKTSKADAISKDMVRRGFRGVGPTVIYSFMQVAGITNDHLISCFRFQDCIAAADASDKDSSFKGKVEGKQPEDSTEPGLASTIDDLSLST